MIFANFISHENRKLTQRIYHTNNQLVRTCEVVSLGTRRKIAGWCFP
jgi:hypothetical protein